MPSRRDEFALSIPMLSRSILHSLFAVVFKFDDPRERTNWFLKSTWREAAEQHTRLVAAHGRDQGWEKWLEGHEHQVQAFRTDAQLPEGAKPDSVEWWPNPGRMVPEMIGPARKAFLGHLNGWYYKELSGESHLSGLRFVKRAGILAELPYRNQSLLAALAIYVSLLTELACQLDMTHQEGHARTVWAVLNTWPPAKQLWERRHERSLGGWPSAPGTTAIAPLSRRERRVRYPTTASP